MKHELAGADSSVPPAFSRDGRRVVTASPEGGLQAWEAASGRLLATLLLFPGAGPADREERLAYTPDGFYDASEGAARRIRWRLDGRSFPAEKYEPVFHHPEQVGKALAGAPG